MRSSYHVRKGDQFSHSILIKMLVVTPSGVGSQVGVQCLKASQQAAMILPCTAWRNVKWIVLSKCRWNRHENTASIRRCEGNY